MQLLESWLYMYLKYYLKCLGYYNLPEFLIKYLNTPSLLRLKNIDMCDIDSIVNNMAIFINEYREYEIGFKSTNVAKKVVDVSKSIDIYCHSREDNYMMQLLARITKISIEKGYISYNNLYSLDEKTLLLILKSKNDIDLMSLIIEFETKKKKDIPDFDMPKVKVRSLNPLVNGKRLL